MTLSRSNGHYLSTRVLALTNRGHDGGVLFEGDVSVDIDATDDPLAVDVLRELRRQGIDVQGGDWLFFPGAGATHRMLQVLPDERLRRV